MALGYDEDLALKEVLYGDQNFCRLPDDEEML